MDKRDIYIKSKLNFRLNFTFACILVLFIILIIRLLSLQIFRHEELLKSANNQRIKKISIFPLKGYIFDRNNIPLTNRRRVKYLYLSPARLAIRKKDELIEKIASITGYNNENLKKIIEKANKYELIKIPFMKEYNGPLINDDYFIIDVVNRYDDDGYLSHIIGYENNNSGSGVEYNFKEYLINENLNNYITVALDGKYRFWPEANYNYVINRNKRYKSIKLSIDYHIQKIAENAFDNNKYLTIENKKRKGAVIVADVKSGDILAMVSRPNYDLNDLSKHLDSKDENFINKAISKSYPPASLFKTIVMVAALENDKIDLNENFFCKGYEVLNGNIIKCHTFEKGGHGELDIFDAFKESCNSVFIQVGKRVGNKKLIDVAKRFGFGDKINIGLSEEKKGNLPKGDELFGPSIGLHSIGQGSLAVTPLQITNMMMIIANDGIQKDMTIFLGNTTEEGKIIKQYRKEKDKRIISKKDAQIIKIMMESVVSNGTASKYINLEKYGGAAGKTGTAQIGRDGWAGWFSGYFPKDSPKYVITVIVEDVNLGGKYAGSIFDEIARKIIELKNK